MQLFDLMFYLDQLVGRDVKYKIAIHLSESAERSNSAVMSLGLVR